MHIRALEPESLIRAGLSLFQELLGWCRDTQMLEFSPESEGVAHM